jgi:cytochrome c-type biogenesis protein CcmH
MRNSPHNIGGSLRARLHRLRKNSRLCLSEGAGGFSPLNQSNELKGLQPRAFCQEWQSSLFQHPVQPHEVSRGNRRALALDPIFWARTLQIALLCAVTVVMLGAGRSRYERLGHELMCSCGCGQILLECNHVSCPDSPVMIGELHAQLDSGKTDTQVLQWFEAKYGATILAAPIRGGFDNAAWIVPAVIFILATLGTFAIVWLWKRRSLGHVGLTGGDLAATGDLNPQDAELRERIRRETEY